MRKFFEISRLWFRKLTLMNIVYFVLTLPLLLGIYICANAAFGVAAGEAVADVLPGLGFYMSLFSGWSRWLLWAVFAVSALLYAWLKCLYFSMILTFYRKEYRYFADILQSMRTKLLRALLLGLLDILLCGQLLANLSGLVQWTGALNWIIRLGSAIALIFWLQVRRYLFLMLAASDLKLWPLIKNSVILSVTGLGGNGKSLAISIVIWAITFLTIPLVTVILLPLVSYSINHLNITCCLYPEIQRRVLREDK